jgi:hypothetical protein
MGDYDEEKSFITLATVVILTKLGANIPLHSKTKLGCLPCHVFSA